MTLSALTLAQTLFGGMVGIVLAYFALRRMRFSSFWAALISAIISLLAYTALTAQYWPGGDVVAIHVALYGATAAGCGLVGRLQHQQTRMHWAPKSLIAFFVFLAVLNAVLLSLSMHGLPHVLARLLLPHAERVNTAFPGVMPHDKNKSYQPHLAQLEKQRILGWRVDTTGLQHLRAGEPNAIRLRIVDAQGQPLEAAQVRLDCWRIADSRDDVQLLLQAQGQGRYGATWTPLPGRWVSLLSIQRGQDQYQLKASLDIGVD